MMKHILVLFGVAATMATAAQPPCDGQLFQTPDGVTHCGKAMVREVRDTKPYIKVLDGNLELKAGDGGVVQTVSDFVVLADDTNDAISVRSISDKLTEVSDDLLTSV